MKPKDVRRVIKAILGHIKSTRCIGRDDCLCAKCQLEHLDPAEIARELDDIDVQQIWEKTKHLVKLGEALPPWRTSRS